MTKKKRIYTDGRLGVAPFASLTEHLHKMELDSELASLEEFVEIDLAHVLTLVECGAIPRADGARLLVALLRIAGPDPDVPLPIDPEAGSILFQIEAYLQAECGPVGGMLQTGRSRIDQDAEGMRLTARRWALQVMGELLELGHVQLSAAERFDDVEAPGYTQLQHSQPTSLGHYLNSHYWGTSRALQRLREAFTRIDQSSLGGAALAGTDWPIDRARTAALLGHGGIVHNARDAGVFALDINAELAGVLALTLSGLGRLAGDIYFWSSSEVGLVRVHPGLCGTSSMMPQKRNPYSVQRIRALAGESVGWQATQLGVLKLATSTDLDIVCARNPVPDMSYATVGAVRLMRDTIETLEIDRPAMKASAAAQWSTASALADALVRHAGCSFRDAHDVVARFVRLSDEAGVNSDTEPSQTLEAAAAEAGMEIDTHAIDLRAALDPGEFIATRSSYGGEGERRRAELAQLARQDLDQARDEYNWALRRIDEARANLHETARSLIDGVIKPAS